MIAVLWHIGQPGQRGPVTVYLDRNPIYLLPELAERGWHYEYAVRETDYVRLILKATE